MTTRSARSRSRRLSVVSKASAVSSIPTVRTQALVGRQAQPHPVMNMAFVISAATRIQTVAPARFANAAKVQGGVLSLAAKATRTAQRARCASARPEMKAVARLVHIRVNRKSTPVYPITTATQRAQIMRPVPQMERSDSVSTNFRVATASLLPELPSRRMCLSWHPPGATSIHTIGTVRGAR